MDWHSNKTQCLRQYFYYLYLYLCVYSTIAAPNEQREKRLKVITKRKWPIVTLGAKYRISRWNNLLLYATSTLLLV